MTGLSLRRPYFWSTICNKLRAYRLCSLLVYSFSITCTRNTISRPNRQPVHEMAGVCRPGVNAGSRKTGPKPLCLPHFSSSGSSACGLMLSSSGRALQVASGNRHSWDNFEVRSLQLTGESRIPRERTQKTCEDRITCD